MLRGVHAHLLLAKKPDHRQTCCWDYTRDDRDCLLHYYQGQYRQIVCLLRSYIKSEKIVCRYIL